MFAIRKTIQIVSLTASAAALLALAPAPAKAADLCLQFDGVTCDLSGDLGFFRFFGTKFPTNPKKSVDLHGRAAGLYAATGTAVQSREGSSMDVLIEFAVDGTPGLANFGVALPATLTVGSTFTGAGSATYGDFGLDSTCNVTIVDCTTEP